jgi:predicted DNA-binding protein (MmcQ/YjbR family)
MDIESFRQYCMAKKAVEESFPFDEHTLVFKVMGKIFAILPLDELEAKANLKALPEWSVELREKYHQVRPGWHMNKKHWNTVLLEEGLDDDLIVKMIDHSYERVVAGFARKMKEEFEKFS